MLQFINIFVFQEQQIAIFELTNRFDFADENSIPTWYSQLILFVASIIMLTLAYLERAKNYVFIWKLLGILFLLGSINEVASIHESTLQVIHLSQFDENHATFFENAWVTVIPIILTCLIVLTYLMYKYLPKKITFSFFQAFCIFLFRAVFLDIIESVTPQGSFFQQGILSALEESLEILAISLINITSIRYIEEQYSNKFSKAIKSL